MTKMRVDPEELGELLDYKHLPSPKKAAVTIIELRTKLEMRTLFLRVSLSLNTALIAGLLAHFLYRS